MKDSNVQTEYWNSAAASKTFSHPIPWEFVRIAIQDTARILDYGCGYGRTCLELAKSGYDNVVGIDISQEMIRRGRILNDNLDLRFFDGISTMFETYSFDVCILFAVLTCIPHDAGQDRAIAEIHRILRPDGIILISDYPLQTDARNQKRYKEFEKEFGVFGVFQTENAAFRHFDMNRIYQLLSGFNIIWRDSIRVCTMNGNESDVFQIAAQKKS